MALYHSPQIVTDKLKILVDFGNRKCYSGVGDSGKDLVSNLNLALDTVSYETSGGGSLAFEDGPSSVSVEFGGGGSFSQTPTEASFGLWAKVNSYTEDIQFVFSAYGPDATYKLVLPCCPTMSVPSQTQFLYGYGRTEIGGSFAPVSPPDYGWHYFVVTITADVISIYADGVLIGEGRDGGYDLVKLENGVLYLGYDIIEYSGPGFVGNIAQFSFHEKALSLREVRQNFDAHRGRFGI